jgi:hypothetical protein
MTRRTRTLDALMIVLALGLVPIGVPNAHAAAIGSYEYAQATARGDRIERIQGFLARDAVRERMLGFGVNASDVEARLGALTDAELAQIETQIEKMPAGGDVLAVIGIVFVILLILELVGVTNVFSAI